MPHFSVAAQESGQHRLKRSAKKTPQLPKAVLSK
jgi:hypothetical protein